MNTAFYTVKIINPWYLSIKLPLADRIRCKYSRKCLKYLYAIKRYVTNYETDYLYESEINEGEFKFLIGYAPFIYNEFINDLTQDSKSILESIIFNQITIPEFDNLYSTQNQHLKQLLSCNRGLFQTYTGYGKSEVISTLVNYVYNTLHKRVLVVTPSNTALDELKSRLYNKYGITTPYFDYESDINLISINGFLRSNSYDPTHPYWTEPLWIIADEVEHCISESAMDFYETLTNVTNMYGFSATTDKAEAQPIYSKIPDSVLNDPKLRSLLSNPFDATRNKAKYCQLITEAKDNVRDVLGRNKYLVGYFGNTVVYKRPDDFKIRLIDVVTSISAADLEIPSDYEYNEVIYNLFTSDRMCRLIESIVYSTGLMFIPMARLQVIDYWIGNYFKKDDFLVLVISSRGYEIYHKGEYQANISMDQMKKLIELDMIGVILGTKSSYSAIDISSLKRSLLLYSKAASVVIQAIGRTARSKEFEIYNISPISNIPMYSKDLTQRKYMIKNYYKDCDITEIRKLENQYGI